MKGTMIRIKNRGANPNLPKRQRGRQTGLIPNWIRSVFSNLPLERLDKPLVSDC